MSMNHYSSSDFPETTQWWSSHHTTMADSSPKTTSSSSSNNHHHHKPDDNSSSAAFWLNPHHLYHAAGGAMFCRQNYNTNTNNNDAAAGGASFDLNSNEDEEEVARGGEKAGIPKDRLFEKPLTPSDVGKLNRLVIPKQHAEKHFPLNGGDSGENGLLLGFEDEVGKSWRFRYSYWNSSQSYVLTKGWSRFVKEKRLDAGDIVVFARHRVDSGRLFIGWRRRNSAGGGNDGGISQPSPPVANGGVGWNRAFYTAQAYPTSRGGQYQIRQSSPLPNYQQQSPDQYSGSVVPIVQKQTTAAASSGNPKRLRLFGVNMECQLADDVSEPSTPVGSPMSSNPYHHHHQYYSNTAHMDISFSGGDDVYRQG